MGRTKTSSVRLPSESEWRPFWLQPTGPLHWIEIFGNDHPVEVEIGSGKGLFLELAAMQSPGHNFFGVEIAAKFALFTACQLAKHSLRNARIAQADARRVFAEWLAPRSVAAVHVYFPDPWWKRRHRKRRIFNHTLVGHIARVLRPGGELHVASDVEQYFHEIQSVIATVRFFHALELAPHQKDPQDAEYLTNFERKYRKAGKPIWRASYRLHAEV